MLIWLDSSVLDADLNSNIDASHGLDCIIGSAHRGENFVIGERHILSELQKSAALSGTSRAVLGHLIANYSTLASFARTVNAKVIASHNKHAPLIKLGAEQWGASIESIGQVGISKAVLIGENLSDADLFEHAALQYRAANRFYGLVALTKLGGGGSTTPGCLQNHAVVEKKWVLCISDSDRLYPAQAKDLTAQKCEFISAAIGIVCSYRDIAPREIENIIPLAFFEEIVPATHTYAWDRHRQQVFTTTPQAHEYGDLKLGTDLKKIFSYGVGSPQRTFWIDIANRLSNAGIIPTGCLNGGGCANQHNGTPCGCIVVQGYGGKILEAVVEKLTLRTQQKSCEMISKDPNQAHWYSIGKQVFEWGCASPRMRV